MSKLIYVLSLFLVLVLLFGCTSSNSGDSTNNAPGANQVGPVTHSIDIRNFSFSPSTIAINQGDSIVWTNNDPIGHTVTGGELNSAVLQKGQTFIYTFNTKGTIDYICSIHTSMKGKVIVQ